MIHKGDNAPTQLYKAAWLLTTRYSLHSRFSSNLFALSYKGLPSSLPSFCLFVFCFLFANRKQDGLLPALRVLKLARPNTNVSFPLLLSRIFVLFFDSQKMGVDGLCTDYPELVHEANRKFRPQATQTDSATFPFPEGPTASSSVVDLRGLAADSETTTTVIGDNNDAGNDEVSVSGHAIVKKAEVSTDSSALGGWYSRGDTCGKSPAEPSHQQRLIAALYGDLAGVRDFSVAAVEEARVLAKVCARGAGVEAFLKRDSMKGKVATRELAAAAALWRAAESEAEQALRPFVSSAETFQWSVKLISTEKVRKTESFRAHAYLTPRFFFFLIFFFLLHESVLVRFPLYSPEQQSSALN